MHTLRSIDLRKISKFDATRCQIITLKCTKFEFPAAKGGGVAAVGVPGRASVEPNNVSGMRGYFCKVFIN